MQCILVAWFGALLAEFGARKTFEKRKPTVRAFNASIPSGGASSARLIFSADSWRLSQGTDNRRSAHCGSETSTFRISYPHLARSVSWRGLSLKIHLSAPVSKCWKIDHHLVASLENPLLGFGWCRATVSCCELEHHSGPILDSPGCLDHSTLAEDLSSHSGSSLKPNSKVSASPLPTPLSRYFPELSWTWHTAFGLKENGCRKTLRNSWCQTEEEEEGSIHFSRIFLSTHQAQLCEFLTRASSLDFCPLMIILIAASLSSKMYNWNSPWGECAFAVTWSTIDHHLGFPYVWGWICLNSFLLRAWLVVWYEQVINPFTVQHPTEWFLIRWNCGILAFVSYTSNLWEQMFDFQRYRRFLPRLILNPQGHQQHLSLGINPVDNAEPCCPHDNIVGSLSCDGYRDQTS